jgi:hypothetical protein
MAGTKYSKNIITERFPKIEAPWTPKFKPDELIPMPFIDETVIKGGFYVETAWTLPPFAKEVMVNLIPMITMRFWLFLVVIPRIPHNLNAEAEVHLGGEVHTVTKSILGETPRN